LSDLQVRLVHLDGRAEGEKEQLDGGDRKQGRRDPCGCRPCRCKPSWIESRAQAVRHPWGVQQPRRIPAQSRPDGKRGSADCHDRHDKVAARGGEACDRTAHSSRLASLWLNGVGAIGGCDWWVRLVWAHYGLCAFSYSRKNGALRALCAFLIRAKRSASRPLRFCIAYAAGLIRERDPPRMERFLYNDLAYTGWLDRCNRNRQDFLRQENRFSLRLACYRSPDSSQDDVAWPGCARPSGSMMMPELAREGARMTGSD